MKTLTMTETQWVSGGCLACPAAPGVCVATAVVGGAYYKFGPIAALYAAAATLSVAGAYILYQILNEE
jgi:hypothetical protein